MPSTKRHATAARKAADATWKSTVPASCDSPDQWTNVPPRPRRTNPNSG